MNRIPGPTVILLCFLGWPLACLWFSVCNVWEGVKVGYVNFIAGMVGVILTLVGLAGLVSSFRLTGQRWVGLCLILAVAWVVGFILTFIYNFFDQPSSSETTDES